MNAHSSAAQRRDRGIKEAAEHAERCLPGWGKAAFQTLRLFIVKHPGKSFLAEDVVTFAQTRIDSPPDNRAWGQIIKSAHEHHVIRRTGKFAKARSSNLSYKPLWVAA